MQTRSPDHLPKRIRKVNIKEILQAAWYQPLGKVQSFLKMFNWALLGWIEILRRQYARKEKPNTCASSSKAAKQTPQTEHSRVHFNVSLPSVLQTKYYQNILKDSKKRKGLKHEVNSENTQCVVGTFPQNPQKPGKSLMVHKMQEQKKSYSEPKEQ